MAITEKELKELIEIKASLEKITTASFDGKNLLTRIPKDACEFLGIRKGRKLKWLVNDKKKISLSIVS